MIFLKKFYSFSGTLHIVFRAGHTSHMFDFLSFDPAPARRDFSEAVEKSFGNCADFESRALSAGGVRLMLFYLDGCVSAEQISKEIVRPVSRLRARSESALLEAALGGGVWACTVRQRSSPADAVSDIAAGYAALVFDGERTALTFEVRTGDKRSVDAPTVEKSVLGAKDAFVESVRVNTALLRRRVGKPTLKLWETVLGSETKTRVDILYIEGAAAPEQVERVKARLSLPDIPAVLAAGDVEQYLAPSPRSAFPQVIHTERPDRFVLGLARGKVGFDHDHRCCLEVGVLSDGQSSRRTAGVAVLVVDPEAQAQPLALVGHEGEDLPLGGVKGVVAGADVVYDTAEAAGGNIHQVGCDDGFLFVEGGVGGVGEVVDDLQGEVVGVGDHGGTPFGIFKMQNAKCKIGGRMSYLGLTGYWGWHERL